VTQPGAATPFEDEGPSASTEADQQNEPPYDTALAVHDVGTTDAEMHDGEPLSARLEREEPDVLSQVGLPAAKDGVTAVGRLVEPDEGARADATPEMVASDVGPDLGGESAEESAMHLEPEV